MALPHAELVIFVDGRHRVQHADCRLVGDRTAIYPNDGEVQYLIKYRFRRSDPQVRVETCELAGRSHAQVVCGRNGERMMAAKRTNQSFGRRARFHARHMLVTVLARQTDKGTQITVTRHELDTYQDTHALDHRVIGTCLYEDVHRHPGLQTYLPAIRAAVGLLADRSLPVWARPHVAARHRRRSRRSARHRRAS